MTDHTTEVATAQVGIIMGSDSDLRVMQAAADMLGQLDVPFEMTIVSAHRTPERMMKYAESARERGLKTIIAGAGGAAHLPGMVASMTTLPVIGVPIAVTALQGQDSLLSIVQMPSGIPVATVAIDNAANAALLAAEILAVSDLLLAERLSAFRDEQTASVLRKVAMASGDHYESLQQLGTACHSRPATRLFVGSLQIHSVTPLFSMV